MEIQYLMHLLLATSQSIHKGRDSTNIRQELTLRLNEMLDVKQRSRNYKDIKT